MKRQEIAGHAMTPSGKRWPRRSRGRDAFRDHMAFLGSWLRRPLRVAALAPSGRQLARLITHRIDPGGGPVLELGAGTGAFTAELLTKGVPAANIHAVELDDRMAEVLTDRFPDVNVTVASATMLIRDGFPLRGDFAVAISGLPVLSMSAQDQVRILAGVFRRLRPGAALYQFTYGHRCPFSALILARLGLRSQRMGGVVRNLPPASVYRVTRRTRPPRVAANDDAGRANRPAARVGDSACPTLLI